MNDSGRSSAYRTLHINTAKNVTNFSDFLFAEEVQRFPSHEDMYAYLKSYAEHFGVTEHIRFNSEVTELIPLFEPGKQESEVADHHGRRRRACLRRRLRLHRPPDQAGARAGVPERLHRHVHAFHDYKEPESMVGKRICVVGIGNSAVDVASDICVNARRCVLVARSGVWIAPKMVFGVAFTDLTDWFMKPWMPAWLRKRLLVFLIWCVHGKPNDWVCRR